MTCMWILALFAASVSAGSLGRQRRQLGPDCQLMNWPALGGNEYGYFDHTRSFTAAEGICMRCQATVASISSAEEMTFVRGLVPDGHPFWLGASDRDTEGTFVWLDGSSMSYTNWKKGEPDNQSTDEANEADCAYVNSHGLWRDNHCDLDSKRFVCKRAATGTAVTTVSPPPTTVPITMMTRPMLTQTLGTSPMMTTTQTLGTSPMMMTTQTMPTVTTAAPVSTAARVADAAPSVDPRVQSMPVFITGRPQQEVSQTRYEEVSRSSPRPTTLRQFTMTDATTPPPPPPPTTTAARRVVTTARPTTTTARATTTVRPTTTTARATTTARPTTTTARATTTTRRPATTPQPRTTEATTRRSIWSYVRGAADKAKSRLSRWFGKRR